MCRAIPGGYDLGREWPLDRDHPVVVVARSDARGLLAAQQVAIRTTPGGAWAGQHVVGLVVISDQPRRLPRPLVDLGRLVSGGYDRVWQIPYVEQWRLGGDPAAGLLPIAVRRLTADLDELSRRSEAEQTSEREPATLTRRI
jgi:hypothetical protein